MRTVVIFGFSPLIALILSVVFRRRIPPIVVGVILIVCVLLVGPLLLTDYYYTDLFDGFYSLYLIKAIIVTALFFIFLNFVLVNKKIKIVILILASIITFGYMGLTLFARGFVGDDKIFSSKRISGYRIVYRQEADAVLTGPTRVDLYKVALLGLLQKNVDFVYTGNSNQPCKVTLKDSLGSKSFVYNFCDNKIYPE